MLLYTSMSKKIKIIKSLKHSKAILFFLGLVGSLILAVFAFLLLYHGRIYPGISIGDVYLGGLTPTEASTKISQYYPFPNMIKINIDTLNNKQSFDFDPINVGINYDYDETAKQAFKTGRSGNLVEDGKAVFNSIVLKPKLNLVVTHDDSKFDEYFSVVKGQVDTEEVHPSVDFIGNDIVVNVGSKGEELDVDMLKMFITHRISQADFSDINIKTDVIDPTINDDLAGLAKDRATKLLNKRLALNFEYQDFEYKKGDLIRFIDPSNSINDDYLNHVVGEIAESIERPPQNSVFQFENGKVAEFKPSKDGVSLDKEKLAAEIINKINELESSNTESVLINIPTINEPPQITNAELNDLGINELIGRGKSTFRGSISSRLYNINLAANRINGTLIKPGEIFSFNKALGEVDKLTGYKEAYIIQDGKTVLGDGGGVCQVSTTFFRAALDAGLPIIERRSHSYRVGYYEQDAGVGLDATVYSPTTDLKIKNDTPAHILVQAIPNIKNSTLVFELYGTSDGRISEITKPIITDSQAPPDDVYVDDPTLPAGQIKQVEYKAWGAKSVFDYKVTRGDEVIYQKKFYSNYKPWGAVYMRGTGPTN